MLLILHTGGDVLAYVGGHCVGGNASLVEGFDEVVQKDGIVPVAGGFGSHCELFFRGVAKFVVFVQ